MDVSLHRAGVRPHPELVEGCPPATYGSTGSPWSGWEILRNRPALSQITPVMTADYGRINHQTPVVRVIRQDLEYTFPDSRLGSAAKPLVGALPVAVTGREVFPCVPLRSATRPHWRNSGCPWQLPWRTSPGPAENPSCAAIGLNSVRAIPSLPPRHKCASTTHNTSLPRR